MFVLSMGVAQELQTQTGELLKCSRYSKKPCSALAGKDVASIAHVTGACTGGGGPVPERPHLLQSEACY